MAWYRLDHPEYFSYQTPDGAPYRGADQMWYRDLWQQRAGCGPTTAATLLAYLSSVHPALSALAPPGRRHAHDFVSYMEDVWQDVTPTSRGLDSLTLFTDGAARFAQRKGCSLDFCALEIPSRLTEQRPSLADCVAFLTDSLSANCPIGFLNFSSGALQNLDNWHWVPLIACLVEGNLTRCIILDEGEERDVDFSLWYHTTSRGGGLVSLRPRNDNSISKPLNRYSILGKG